MEADGQFDTVSAAENVTALDVSYNTFKSAQSNRPRSNLVLPAGLQLLHRGRQPLWRFPELRSFASGGPIEMKRNQYGAEIAEASQCPPAEAVALRKQKVLQQSSSVFSAQMVALAAGVLCTFLVARLGGAEGKGLLYRLQFVSSVALVLLNCGLGPAAVYLFRREAQGPANKIQAEEMAALLLWPSLLLGCLPLAALELSRLMPGLVHLGGWQSSALLAFAAVPACTLVWNLSYLYLATGEGSLPTTCFAPRSPVCLPCCCSVSGWHGSAECAG